jgi:outer membrane protein W
VTHSTRFARSGQALALLSLLLCARPAHAQIDVRPFALFAEEHFAASGTFNAIFQSDVAPLWGGGVDVVVHKHVFVDFAVSHMSRDGQRAFVSNGDVFRLQIPLRLESTPIEVTGGYRFVLERRRVIPYIGAGFGSYSFHQTSDFDTAGESIDVRHMGIAVTGGAEVRVTRWIGITADVRYTHVTGILGSGDISKDLGENDFGGVAGRIRVIFGR